MADDIEDGDDYHAQIVQRYMDNTLDDQPHPDPDITNDDSTIFSNDTGLFNNSYLLTEGESINTSDVASAEDHDINSDTNDESTINDDTTIYPSSHATDDDYIPTDSDLSFDDDVPSAPLVHDDDNTPPERPRRSTANQPPDRLNVASFNGKSYSRFTKFLIRFIRFMVYIFDTLWFIVMIQYFWYIHYRRKNKAF